MGIGAMSHYYINITLYCGPRNFIRKVVRMRTWEVGAINCDYIIIAFYGRRCNFINKVVRMRTWEVGAMSHCIIITF